MTYVWKLRKISSLHFRVWNHWNNDRHKKEQCNARPLPGTLNEGRRIDGGFLFNVDSRQCRRMTNVLCRPLDITPGGKLLRRNSKWRQIVVSSMGCFQLSQKCGFSSGNPVSNSIDLIQSRRVFGSVVSSLGQANRVRTEIRFNPFLFRLIIRNVKNSRW